MRPVWRIRPAKHRDDSEDAEKKQIKEDSLSNKQRNDKQVATPKISNTHELETTKGEGCEEWERKSARKGQLPTGSHRATDK
jgi:hypothetical protein